MSINFFHTLWIIQLESMKYNDRFNSIGTEGFCAWHMLNKEIIYWEYPFSMCQAQKIKNFFHYFITSFMDNCVY